MKPLCDQQVPEFPVSRRQESVVIISFWRISESRSAGEARADWWGALLATVGLGGLVNGFIESASLSKSEVTGFAQSNSVLPVTREHNYCTVRGKLCVLESRCLFQAGLHNADQDCSLFPFP